MRYNTTLFLIAGLVVGAGPLLGSEQFRVAVLDTPGEGPLATGLADFIQVVLQKQGVETYDRRYLHLVVTERGLAKADVLEPGSLRRLALPAMKAFVRGSAEWTGTNHFALLVEAFRSSDGTVLVKQVEPGDYPGDWLAAVERGAEAVGRRLLDTETNSGPRGKPRSVLWMPEASSWFLRGMECYRNNDYLQAAMCFWKARRWDEGFNAARYWEIKSYRQTGFPEFSGPLLGSSRLAGWQDLGRVENRIAVVTAGPGITPEQRSAFERALTATNAISLLAPAWIGATAQDADLQLTGEMAPRSENRNVWLAIDEVVMLERADQQILARRYDAVTVTEKARAETSDLSLPGMARLAEALLHGATGSSKEAPTASGKASLAFFAEGTPEAMRIQALKAIIEHPKDVRYLLEAAEGLRGAARDMDPTTLGEADFPPEWGIYRALLDRAIQEIQNHPDQPEASFWLTYALWRKRISRENHMVTWRRGLPLTPLKDDFKQLFELFPASPEAANLAEVRADDFYMRTMPKDERFLEAALSRNFSSLAMEYHYYRRVVLKDERYRPVLSTNRPSSALPTEAAPREKQRLGTAMPSSTLPAEPAPLDNQPLELVSEFKRSLAESNYCRAWAAQYELSRLEVSISSEAPQEASRFLIACRNASYRINNDAIVGQFSQGNLPLKASELLEAYHPPIDGERRAREISAICDPFIKQSQVPTAITQFLLRQSSRWRTDYGTLAIPPPVNHGDAPRDPASLVLQVAYEHKAAVFASAEAVAVFQGIGAASGVEVGQRLLAQYAEGVTYYNMGDYFAATEALRRVLAEVESTQGSSTGIPPGLSDRALAMLRTARLFGDSTLNFRLCCGVPKVLPLPPTANSNEVEALYVRFKKQIDMYGRVVDTNQPLVKVKDMGQSWLVARVSQDLVPGENLPLGIVNCIKALRTNAAPLVPQLVSMLLTSGSGAQQNIMATLGYIGHGAAEAMPVVLLSLELAREQRGFLQNVLFTLNRLGPPPRQVIPYVARLVYHPNQSVALNAAKVIQNSRLLPPQVQTRLTDTNLVSEIQNWWEETGRFQSWTDGDVPPTGKPTDYVPEKHRS